MDSPDLDLCLFYQSHDAVAPVPPPRSSCVYSHPHMADLHPLQLVETRGQYVNEIEPKDVISSCNKQ